MLKHRYMQCRCVVLPAATNLDSAQDKEAYYVMVHEYLRAPVYYCSFHMQHRIISSSRCAEIPKHTARRHCKRQPEMVGPPQEAVYPILGKVTDECRRTSLT